MRSGELADQVAVNLGLSYGDYLDAQFLRPAWKERLTVILGGGWVTRAELGDAPGEILGGANYFHSARSEVLVRVERAICHLILHERSLVARVAATSVDHAEQAVRAAEAALPEVDSTDREVSARFWWWTQHGPTDLARMLP